MRGVYRAKDLSANAVRRAGLTVPSSSLISNRWRGFRSPPKASGASVFHFCKVFKKTTGLKFTDYVARLRLEDAKAQLLNPSRRISEVAYDVGFQSLTQFNRMFKRVFGESPTEFRANLSGKRRSSNAA